MVKNQLENERKKTKELECGQANYISGKSELEEFFLECVEEVKKNIKKRKEFQIKNTRYSKSTAKTTVSTSSKEPKLAGFASQDKAKVIELLMENDNVLLFLYEKLFPVTTLSTNQIMMKTEQQNQAQMAKAGSRLSLLT
jgi:hypothetical protein